MAFRYLGNKTRIVDWLVANIRATVAPGCRIADPMCGTATVAHGLAAAGYVVTAADELTFPVLHSRARLLPTARCDFMRVAANYADAIRRLNEVEPVRGYFFREFSDEGQPSNGVKPRAYFTGPNAARLDGIRAELRRWASMGLPKDAVELLLHDLVLAANAFANIAGTYGYYRSTWNPKSRQPLTLTPSPWVAHDGGHQVLQGKAEQIAPTLQADACYLDPPYTKRQYGGNYHIPETLARQDEPEPQGEGGLRDWRPEYSMFCSKIHAPAALRAVLAGLHVEWIFLSYSEDGVIGEQNLREILASFGSVQRHDKPLQRFRSNGGKPGAVTEHLYVLRKR